MSNFNNLYRDLCKATPSGKVFDTSYERERNEVMYELFKKTVPNPEKVFHRPKPVTLPEHHGKLARRKEHANRQKAITTDNRAEAAKHKSLRDQINEIDRMQSVTQRIKKFVDSDEPIPDKLLRQLQGKRINEAATLPPIGKQQQPQEEPEGVLAKIAVAKARKEALVARSRIHAASFEPAKIDHRQQSAIRKTVTVNRWTLEERSLLNSLYLEIPRPVAKVRELWSAYYEHVASRFAYFYPKRSLPEIQRKVMLACLLDHLPTYLLTTTVPYYYLLISPLTTSSMCGQPTNNHLPSAGEHDVEAADEAAWREGVLAGTVAREGWPSSCWGLAHSGGSSARRG